VGTEEKGTSKTIKKKSTKPPKPMTAESAGMGKRAFKRLNIAMTS
jgi:hypothetical protein